MNVQNLENGKTDEQNRDKIKSGRIGPFKTVNIPLDTSPALIEKFARQHFIYSMYGLSVGLSCVLGGFLLLCLDIGQPIKNVVLKVCPFLSTELVEAAPGAILIIVGLFIAWITRYKIKVKK